MWKADKMRFILRILFPNIYRSLVPLYRASFQPIFLFSNSLKFALKDTKWLASQENYHLKGFNKLNTLREFSGETELH